jgi:hypothetical protein
MIIPYYSMKRTLLLLFIASSILTFFILFPYSLKISYALPNAIDPLFYAWNISHNYTSASHGFKDLLDTNIFYPEGNTLAFSDTLFAQTILTAPILLLTKNPIFTENFYVFLTFPLSAIAMFCLSYYLTRHTLASLLSSIFYAFSIPRLAQIGHMPAISSQWLPLYFLFLIRYLREKTYINLLLTLFWYILSIASSVYFGLFLIPLTGIIVIVELVSQPWEIIGKIFKDILKISFPSLVILIFILFPYIRLRVENPNIRRNLRDTAALSAVPVDYISVLPTSWLSDIGFPKNTNEHPLYPTITVSMLALLSILFMRTYKKSLAGFIFMGIGAFVLSFGPYANYSPDTSTYTKLPYYYMYKILPIFESIRVPARFSIFVILAASVCASFTLSKLLKKSTSWALVIIIGLLFFIEVWQIQTPFVSIPTAIPLVYQWLAKQPDSDIIVELPMQPLPQNTTTMESQLMLPYVDLREDTIFANEAYRIYFSSFHNKRMVNGYSGFFPQNYHDQATALLTFPSDGAISTLQRIHVKYIIIHTAQYTGIPFSDTERHIREQPKLVKKMEFGSDIVYEIVQSKQ